MTRLGFAFSVTAESLFHSQVTQGLITLGDVNWVCACNNRFTSLR